MPRELNPRQLRAINEYIKTGVKSRAYACAGYRYRNRQTLDAAAANLFRNAKIAAEIRRRKRAMIKRSDITIEKLLQDLADDRALARSVDQPGAAIQATQLAAKLVGLLVDRKESGAPGDFAGLKDPAEVLAALRAELGDKYADQLQAALAARDEEQGSKPDLLSDIEPSGAIN